MIKFESAQQCFRPPRFHSRITRAHRLFSISMISLIPSATAWVLSFDSLFNGLLGNPP